MLRLYKLQVVPVYHELDADGDVIGEVIPADSEGHALPPREVFVKGLPKFVEELEAQTRAEVEQ